MRVRKIFLLSIALAIVCAPARSAPVYEQCNSQGCAPIRPPGEFAFYIIGKTPGTPGARPLTLDDYRVQAEWMAKYDRLPYLAPIETTLGPQPLEPKPAPGPIASTRRHWTLPRTPPPPRTPTTIWPSPPGVVSFPLFQAPQRLGWPTFEEPERLSERSVGWPLKPRR
jgi:hypothetical protein